MGSSARVLRERGNDGVARHPVQRPVLHLDGADRARRPADTGAVGPGHAADHQLLGASHAAAACAHCRPRLPGPRPGAPPRRAGDPRLEASIGLGYLRLPGAGARAGLCGEAGAFVDPVIWLVRPPDRYDRRRPGGRAGRTQGHGAPHTGGARLRTPGCDFPRGHPLRSGPAACLPPGRGRGLQPAFGPGRAGGA